MNRHHDHVSSYKGKLLIGSEVQFIIMVGHGSMQPGLVLEKELRIHRQQEVNQDNRCDFSIYETSKPTLTVVHFLQQSHNPIGHSNYTGALTGLISMLPLVPPAHRCVKHFSM